MCYAVYLKDAPDRAWAVLTGDTLFIGEAGRTDLTDPSKTAEHAGQLYDAVHAQAPAAGRPDDPAAGARRGVGLRRQHRRARRFDARPGAQLQPGVRALAAGVHPGQARRAHSAPAVLPPHGAGELGWRHGGSSRRERRAGAAAEGLPVGVAPRNRVRPAPAGGLSPAATFPAPTASGPRACRSSPAGSPIPGRRSTWWSTMRRRRWTMPSRRSRGSASTTSKGCLPAASKPGATTACPMAGVGTVDPGRVQADAACRRLARDRRARRPGVRDRGAHSRRLAPVRGLRRTRARPPCGRRSIRTPRWSSPAPSATARAWRPAC